MTHIYFTDKKNWIISERRDIFIILADFEYKVCTYFSMAIFYGRNASLR